MCKLEGIKWIILEPIKPLTKTQKKILSKHRFNCSLMEWYADNNKRALMLLGIEKAKIKGKIIEITDKQFGMCLNYYSYNKIKDTTPLNHTYVYKYEYRLMLIPVTKKQIQNIITI